jgi:NDP-sugar pyrophosphorylase family protein
VSHQVLEQLVQDPPQDGYLRAAGSLVHRTSRIDPSVRLVGPVLVGPHVELGAGSVVVGPATLGARTRIAGDAVVCRSVMWSECIVEEGAVLDQCIVTNNSVVRAGREVRHSVVVPSRRARRRQQSSAGMREVRKPATVVEPILSPAPVGTPGSGEMTLNLVGSHRGAADAKGSKVNA